MYFQLVSIHGLVRSDRVEMGRDADTGGQVRYVLELAKSLAKMPEVTKVDLITRLIRDPKVDNAYRQQEEEIGENCRLIRLPCGPDDYLRKELLWPYLDEFADRLRDFSLQQPELPTVIHGHYADAGFAARKVAERLGVSFVFTGHSLGIPKLEYLEAEGWSREKANEILHIDRRITEEQACLDAAKGVVVSTSHERVQQWGGYSIPESLPIEVIPPGTDLDRFFPYYQYEMPGEDIAEEFKQARHRMQHRLARFLSEPEKPLLLALCRPDRRKNIQSLIKAYGESPQLQAIANLAVFAGIREDIETMPENEQEVLTDILLLMDRYDLYGKMAIPKHHDSDFDVPELYRIAASTRGLFVNTAFIELFGLTAIEASATGLPFVVTKNGGPQDIVANCKSGKVVDVNIQEELVDAMLELLTDSEQWETCSDSGINLVREHYAWETHSKQYLEWLRKNLGSDIITETPASSSSAGGIGLPSVPSPANPDESGNTYRSSALDSITNQLRNAEVLLISDIDGTLLGDDDSLYRLLSLLDETEGRLVFGVATGRSPALVQEVLDEYGINNVSLIVASVGSEILIGRNHDELAEWSHQITHSWQPDLLTTALRDIPWLEQQAEPHTQRAYKLSYRLLNANNPEVTYQQLRAILDNTGLQFNLVISHGDLVDFLPVEASKGQAIRFLMQQTGFDASKLVTAGDSGNDFDMICGLGKGIVVGNHAPEVECLRDLEDEEIYFSQAHHAAGILEGLEHFGLLRNPRNSISK